MGYLMEDSPASGKPFDFETSTPSNTDSDGYNYTINITGIPPECDATNTHFTINIDGDNVTFTEPTPDNSTWQTTSEVRVGVKITDVGGGYVDGSSVMQSLSIDNGTSWETWKPVTGLDTALSIEAHEIITLPDGTNNLIKWRAFDTLGNGPAESDWYRVPVDTQNVTFSNATPMASEVSLIERVEVGITIYDCISGVNASTIECSISFDKGITWSSWMSMPGLRDGMKVNITRNLTFQNGTANRIKWRASDLAGNGPCESEIYTINVNTWRNKLLPKVKLKAPENGSTISSKSVELSWILTNTDLDNVTYNVFLDTVNPPVNIRKVNHTNTSLMIMNLLNEETYYWCVIPKIGIDNGTCLSGIWSFDVEIKIPRVTLISPPNNSKIKTLIPTLSWSVNYDGSELVNYNIYLGTELELEMVAEGYSMTNYYPPILLEEGKTYYWKILPIAGDTPGPASEIWLFTVEESQIPMFALKLEVIPPIIELKPGENSSVKARVTNLGELNDYFILVSEVPDNIGIIALIIEPNSTKAESKEFVEFLINVKVMPGTKEDEVVLSNTAISGRAQEYGLEVNCNATLTIKVFEVERQKVLPALGISGRH